jgi:DNA-binding NarL/FixJ family response regulator
MYDDRRENEETPLRVIVADDDPLTRKMICAALEADGIEIVGQARDGDEAVSLGVELRPDLVLMDVVMPGTDGIAATARLTEAAPDVSVVALSVTDDEELGMLALRLGAVGFLTKDIEASALARVLRAVVGGEAAIKRTLTRRLIRDLQSAPTRGIGMRPVRSTLTAREWEVLDLLCAGAATNDIAAQLGLSAATLRSHLKSIYRKLEVHSRAEAVAAAKRLREPSAVALAR